MERTLMPESASAMLDRTGGQAPPAVLVPPRLSSQLPEIRAGFTGGWPRWEDGTLLEAATHLLGSATRPVLMDQPHGAEILDFAQGHDAGQALRGAYDGLVDRAPGGRTLLIKSADCVPVLAAHPASGRYAALHAGWRGVAKGILPALLRHWGGQGIDARGVWLALGPHILPCCFEVKADCLAQFGPQDLSGAVAERGGATYLSLERVVRSQAANAGILDPQVEVLALCTSCHCDAQGAFVFASYRRSRREGTAAGRNLSFIGTA